MNLPPGPKSPYFWQLLQILFNPTDSLDKWSKKYGDLAFREKTHGYAVGMNHGQGLLGGGES